MGGFTHVKGRRKTAPTGLRKGVSSCTAKGCPSRTYEIKTRSQTPVVSQVVSQAPTVSQVVSTVYIMTAKDLDLAYKDLHSLLF